MAQLSRRRLWTNKLTQTVENYGKRIANTTKEKPHQSKNPSLDITPKKVLILGIDPSLRSTGIALIAVEGKHKQEAIHLECWPCELSLSFVACLGRLSEAITQVLKTYPIDIVAIEEPIYVQNFKTAQILGSVRGTLLGIVAAQNLPIFEYRPLRIKKAVVGNGKASKYQVIKMVQSLLKLENEPASDEADAAAVALCHAFVMHQLQ
jgi:crossover junction endodeoxyribonuclease RuvC